MISETFLPHIWHILFLHPDSDVVLLQYMCMYFFFLCLFFFLAVWHFQLFKSSSLIEPERGSENRVRESEYEKEKTKKKEKKREDSIDEATSPPFPPRSSASRFAPETELQGEGIRRRRRREEKSETREGRWIKRNIWIWQLVFKLDSALETLHNRTSF